MINWKVRFSKKNMSFLIRFLGALLIPILAYMGLKFEDLTTWTIVFTTLLDFISNPFLVVLTLVNAINIIPDPTSTGLTDSKRVMTYDKPNEVK